MRKLKNPTTIICIECQQEKQHHALGMCRRCYDKIKERKPHSKVARKKQREEVRQRNIEFLQKHVELKCVHCGYNDFISLDMHHTDPQQKEHSQDSLAHWISCYSLKRLEEKLKTLKFIILCANCHRKLHYEEKQCK